MIRLLLTLAIGVLCLLAGLVLGVRAADVYCECACLSDGAAR